MALIPKRAGLGEKELIDCSKTKVQEEEEAGVQPPTPPPPVLTPFTGRRIKIPEFYT